MTVTTRFAPAPSGRLHVGNLRAALHNYLWARQHKGRFVLRLDDTDQARSTAEYADAIVADLGWMGLVPDIMVRQSDRFALYEARFAELVDQGRIYPAYESEQELDLKRKILAGRGLPPIYDRAALRLSDADRAAFAAEGRQPHWRFRLDHEEAMVWDDLIQGPKRFDPRLQSDPVIRRADGSWLYMLPSVIDDVDLGISHVVRGEDHVTNTALQLQMFGALGATPPAFAHAALLAGREGKLSKRLGSLGCDALREDGIEPLAVAAFLARLGTSEAVAPVADLQPLIDGIDFAHFGRAPARFDVEELRTINARTIHLMPFEAVEARLPIEFDAASWAAIAPNLQTIAEAGGWLPVLVGELPRPDLSDEDRAFCAEAAQIAAAIEWGDAPWASLTGALKEATGRKGKALFLPLRLALTARDHGPDMAALLPLIGRDLGVARLAAAG